MTLRELMQVIFSFYTNTSTTVQVRLVRRDEHDVITHEKILDIVSIYNPAKGPIGINVEESELDKQWREV